MRKFEVTWRSIDANTHEKHIVEGYSIGDVVAGLYSSLSNVKASPKPPVGIVNLTIKEIFE